MLIHNSANLQIYFGDANHGISFQDYQDIYNNKGSILPAKYDTLKQSFHLEQCLFLKQTHSIEGMVITHSNINISPFEHEGDFLITDQPHVGLAILTADCLPIILYDPTKQVIAIAHAGLKGSLAEITPRVIELMKNRFDCQPEQLQAFCGPAAKWCCYQIGEDIANLLKQHDNYERYLIYRHNNYYLDLAQFNTAQLEQSGVNRSTLCLDYNYCTICSSGFNSYRRQQQAAGRQITMVSLR